MCSYAPYQHNCDFITHFGFYPVRIAFYVENHSVVAQKAGAWIPRLNVGWAGPIRLLHLENPGIEGTANASVLFCELCQQFFPY